MCALSEFVGVANQTVPPSPSDDHTTSPERTGVHLTLDVLPKLWGSLTKNRLDSPYPARVKAGTWRMFGWRRLETKAAAGRTGKTGLLLRNLKLSYHNGYIYNKL